MLSKTSLKLSNPRGVRFITIQQPNTTVTTEPVSLDNKVDLVKANTLPAVEHGTLDTINAPVFKTIGTPSSSLSVTLPPSVPVNVKKGSVISVYSFENNSKGTGTEQFIRSNWKVIQPLRQILLSGYASRYQSVISTVPLQLLVSAYDSDKNSKSSSTKSFVSLTLDGSADWILFDPNSLQCYVGNSLNVSVKNLPNQLHYGFKGRGYTWLNGRGIAAVVGKGSVFKVGLGANEEIRVDRNNIFAVTVSDLSELSSGNNITAEKWNSMDGLFHKITDNVENKIESSEIKVTNNVYIDKTLSYLKNITLKAWGMLKTGQSELTDYVMGSGNYVVVKGPRTVLIQTGSGSDNFVVNAKDFISKSTKDNVSILENVIKNEEEFRKPEPKTGDNLGVVRFIDGKPQYENLENFNKEVSRIEGLTNKK